MNGAIGRVQEKEEDEEPEETSGPKPILPYTSMFVFKSEDQIRVACHYIGNVAIRSPGFTGKVSPITLHHVNQGALCQYSLCTIKQCDRVRCIAVQSVRFDEVMQYCL